MGFTGWQVWTRSKVVWDASPGRAAGQRPPHQRAEKNIYSPITASAPPGHHQCGCGNPFAGHQSWSLRRPRLLGGKRKKPSIPFGFYPCVSARFDGVTWHRFQSLTRRLASPPNATASAVQGTHWHFDACAPAHRSPNTTMLRDHATTTTQPPHHNHHYHGYRWVTLTCWSLRF